MRLKIAIVFLFFAAIISLDAQPLFFEKHFGTALPDAGRSLVQLPSGSLYIVGNSASGNLGDTDISLQKLDKYGNLLWTEYYGDANLNYGYSINKCLDGNLIIVGDALVTSNDTDVLIYKIDTIGNIIWQYIYSTPLNESVKYIEQTTDGGFIAAGFQTDIFGFNNSLVLKIDAAGNYVWHKSIGGADNDYASMIKQMPGGNLILTADTRSAGAGAYDVELTKMDANGNIIWQYTYGDSLNNGCQGIYYSPAGFFMSYGETEIFPSSPFDMFIEKIDTNGVSIWKKYFGNYTNTDACFSLCETTELGFVLTGYSNSYNSGAPIDLAVIKTDSAGNQLWARGYGGGGVDIGYQIIPSLDSGYYITGKYFDVEFSDEQYYLLHIEKNYGGLSFLNENVLDNDFLIYPNPNNGNYYIQFPVETREKTLRIYTVEGKKIMEAQIGENVGGFFVGMPINTRGLYILELTSKDYCIRKKMIVD
jgi:hypothetical protein